MKEKKPFVVLQAPKTIRPPPAEVELYIYAKMTDPEGNVLWEMPQRKSDSFVTNFLLMIGGVFTGANAAAIDKDNTSQNIWQGGQNIRNSGDGNPVAGNEFYGIIVGSDNTAVTNTDYWMGTHIVDGAGAGELLYNVQNLAAPAEVGPNVDMEYKRAFTNLSGGAVAVEETGIAVSTNVPKYHLIARDLLSVSVVDNCSLLVVYTWRTTV